MIKHQTSKLFVPLTHRNILRIALFVILLLTLWAKPLVPLAGQEVKKQNATQALEQNANNKVIMGYFSAGHTVGESIPYPSVSTLITGKQIASKLTHILYAFAMPTNAGVCSLPALSSGLTHQQNFNDLYTLKQNNPTLKLLISIGGEGSDQFKVLSTTAAINTFVQSCITGFVTTGSLMQDSTLRFDGIDVDWEPSAGWVNDSAPDFSYRYVKNYVQTLQQFRQQLPIGKLLTTAQLAANAGGPPGQLDSLKAINPNTGFSYLKEINDAVDLFNVMSYNYFIYDNSYPGGLITRHQARLTVDTMNYDKASTAYTLSFFLNSGQNGIAANK